MRRIPPPLAIQREEIDCAFERISEVIAKTKRSGGKTEREARSGSAVSLAQLYDVELAHWCSGWRETGIARDETLCRYLGDGMARGYIVSRR